MSACEPPRRRDDPRPRVRSERSGRAGSPRGGAPRDGPLDHLRDVRGLLVRVAAHDADREALADERRDLRFDVERNASRFLALCRRSAPRADVRRHRRAHARPAQRLLVREGQLSRRRLDRLGRRRHGGGEARPCDAAASDHLSAALRAQLFCSVRVRRAGLFYALARTVGSSSANGRLRRVGRFAPRVGRLLC